MDPALWEVLRSETLPGDREIEAIVRLDHPRATVPGMRIISRFGPIATCRLPIGSILEIRGHERVLGLKAAKLIGRETEPTWRADPGNRRSPRTVRHDNRRPPGLPWTGAGVVIGIVDFGLDFDHPAFKHADGTTRVLRLWDQRGGPSNLATYGYGVVHDHTAINRALTTSRPYEALGYHPGLIDHGTRVTDIAAGSGYDCGPPGVAPRAHIVFVHAAEGREGTSLVTSPRILEAVNFISHTAGKRPWVINISMGRCAGSHDGCSYVEQSLDYLLEARRNRAITISAGNYFEHRTHASGHLQRGQRRELTVITHEDDLTPNEIEIWYSGDDEFLVHLTSPIGTRSGPVRLGEQITVTEFGANIGRLYSRACDSANSDHLINIFLDPSAPPGQWTVTLLAIKASNGDFHAWIERDEACAHCQAHFSDIDVDNRCTTGTIANGRLPLICAAYDPHSPDRAIAVFSSSGPTRDLRRNPCIAAPGVDILAARSNPPWKPSQPRRAQPRIRNKLRRPGGRRRNSTVP